jgi:hypothetical protein
MPTQDALERATEAAQQGGRPPRLPTTGTPQTPSKMETLTENLWTFHDNSSHPDFFAACAACKSVKAFVLSQQRLKDAL